MTRLREFVGCLCLGLLLGATCGLAYCVGTMGLRR